MPFEMFHELYTEGIKPRLKRNTWNTKVHIIETKILPHFKGRPLNKIEGSDISKWESALMNTTTSSGLSCVPTYLRTVANLRRTLVA